MPTVRFASPSSQDVSEGAGFLEHQVLLSEASTQVVTVTITGASYRDGDMQWAPQVVTFQPGQTTATFRAAVYEDTIYEGNEVFSYDITSATNATIDRGSTLGLENSRFLGYILDNDAPTGPTVRFSGSPTQDVSEGAGFLEHQVTLSAPSAQVVTVTITGASYRDGDMQWAPQVVTFQPGQTTATFRAAVYEDTIYEGNEVFSYDITSATNATIDRGSTLGLENSRFLGYILDNDAPTGPTVRFSGSPTQDVSEGAGFLEHQVTLSAPSAQVVTVTITGASYRDGDMQWAPQVVTFQPGQTTATFRAAVYEDTIYEGNEVFSYDITSATNATIDRGSTLGLENSRFLGYILDNDAPGSGPAPVAGVQLTATTASATLLGGPNNDTVTGTSGSNFLRGNEGDDVIRGGSGFDDTHGNAGNDTVSGGDGDDWVVGGKDNDLLRGDGGADVVYGNLGNDTCEGGDGADIVRGGQQNDVLSGGAGDDFLSGDRDSDTLSGGAGVDVFNFFAGAGSDRILDFNPGEGDRIRWEGSSVSYVLTSNGVDTTVNFGNGDQILLVGVNGANLVTGWLFTVA